jgi:hypothetical protein
VGETLEVAEGDGGASRLPLLLNFVAPREDIVVVVDQRGLDAKGGVGDRSRQERRMMKGKRD